MIGSLGSGVPFRPSAAAGAASRRSRREERGMGPILAGAGGGCDATTRGRPVQRAGVFSGFVGRPASATMQEAELAHSLRTTSMYPLTYDFDVVVVGAGHAGAEA